MLGIFPFWGHQISEIARGTTNLLNNVKQIFLKNSLEKTEYKSDLKYKKVYYF